jgi:hypothetical protein
VNDKLELFRINFVNSGFTAAEKHDNIFTDPTLKSYQREMVSNPAYVYSILKPALDAAGLAIIDLATGQQVPVPVMPTPQG